MKTSGQYATIITLLITLLAAAAVLLGILADFRYDFLQYAVPAIPALVGTFLIVRYYFSRFVQQKINPIFKTIRSHALDEQEQSRRAGREDIVKQLDREVQVWTTNKTEEIRKLRQLERYRKDFLGNVSHELKTPIFNIQGYILTLLDGGIKDDHVNRMYLKRAEKSINRLINILEDLDAIGRLESGEFKLQMERFNLVKAVEEVFEDHEMQARKRRIRLGFDSSYNKPVFVMGDRKRIMEAIGNLINNSIKYGKPGGRTTVGFVDTGENILVDITDNGIGIEEKDLPRIFERFFRVDKSRSRESGGTGLGLSIVKHVIQAHKQTITVRSKADKGTSFIFSLDKA